MPPDPMSTKKEKYVCNQCSRCAVENTAVLGCVDDDCPCHSQKVRVIISNAITTAVAKDRELGNPYNSVSTWKEIGKKRGYWDFFKDQIIAAREKEIAEEVEKLPRGFNKGMSECCTSHNLSLLSDVKKIIIKH